MDAKHKVGADVASVRAETGDVLLEVRDLKTYFFVGKDVYKAVDGVTFTIHERETFALVGESGSGKSVTAASILQIVPNPPGRIVGGEIMFAGEDLLKRDDDQMRSIRGRSISMIFQEPMTSLNPVFRIGDQIAEAVLLHQDSGRQNGGQRKRQAMEQAIAMLDAVGIPDPARRARDYPHQLSGGMRQRAMIAMALVCQPKMLIADEPTSALDVTIQAQILDLLHQMQDEFHTAILLITHDFGVVAENAHSVGVMYAGQMVETAGVDNIFAEPLHPYTQGLLASIPRMDGDEARLHVITGTVPNAARFPDGCRFAPRCPMRTRRCAEQMPELTQIQKGHFVRCHAVGGGDV